MKFSNKYLLTHHPLAWNTRILWVLAAQIILHILFFLSGLASVHVTEFKEYYSSNSVGSSSVITFSILCTLLTFVTWLIYYLRNNAFKSNYLLSPLYLQKEFLIIFLISFLAITYFESFYTGVRMRVRSITDVETLQKEIDIVNRAKAFVPTGRNEYFILGPGYQLDTTVLVGSSLTKDIIAVREALKRPDAFSYVHYNLNIIQVSPELADPDFFRDSIQRRKWLIGGAKDSVRQSLQRMIEVLKKYKIDYSLPLDSLVNIPFQSATFTPMFYVATGEYDYTRPEYQPLHRHYLKINDLQNVYSFIEDSHHTSDNWNEKWDLLLAMGYVAISLSILILCYRRFTRKVYLISIIGSILWVILISLMTAGSGSFETFPSICLILGILFYMGALFFLKSGENKSMTGAVLCWHAFLLPFLVMFLYIILENNYDNIRVPELIAREGDVHAYKKKISPFLSWVHDNYTLIIWINLLLAIMYITGPFNKLTKRWSLMPEQ